MKYGFVIDNRKCIGCHACTVACKSEHDVPIGVNRTWVKQVEKGIYPDTQRLFSVMRCNHCTEAPCVSICPVEALHIREDGIVDFDSERCIGCKACMQACPYDALYIDPETHTAAKCNYCAHRIDVGLEPACVNVCPEHAIISGDMENPDSEISKLLSSERATVRKPEKGTQPNLFYIEGDTISLRPEATSKESAYLFSAQDTGVGHFAKYAEKRLKKGGQNGQASARQTVQENPKTQVQAIMEKGRRVYDAPDKGVLWGWEVSGYVWTKAIAAGAILVPALAEFTGFAEVYALTKYVGAIAALLFLTLTGILLIKDLDQPLRFLNVLLRPQWDSWLVRGGYAITVFGGLVTLFLVALFFGWPLVEQVALIAGTVLALLVAVYTAFLFAQAKGRDFWQSPMLAFHMLVNSLLAGAAGFAMASFLGLWSEDWLAYIQVFLLIGLALHALILLFELSMPHPTADAKTVVKMITQGRYKNQFWAGVVGIGIVVPYLILAWGGALLMPVAGLLIWIGLYITEHIWVQAPQKISLS